MKRTILVIIGLLLFPMMGCKKEDEALHPCERDDLTISGDDASYGTVRYVGQTYTSSLNQYANSKCWTLEEEPQVEDGNYKFKCTCHSRNQEDGD